MLTDSIKVNKPVQTSTGLMTKHNSFLCQIMS